MCHFLKFSKTIILLLALGLLQSSLANNSDSSSKVEHEGKRAKTRQYDLRSVVPGNQHSGADHNDPFPLQRFLGANVPAGQYGEEPRSDVDKVIRMKWGWNEKIQNKFMNQAVQHNAWTALSSNSGNMLQQTSNAKNSLQYIKIPQPETEEKQAKIFDFGKITPSPSNIRFSLNNNHPFYCSLDQLAPSCRGHSEPFLNGAIFSGSLLFPSKKIRSCRQSFEMVSFDRHTLISLLLDSHFRVNDRLVCHATHWRHYQKLNTRS